MNDMLVRQETPTLPLEPLSLSDTCDGCGHSVVTEHGSTRVTDVPVSRAYVRVVFPDGTFLLFCGHHFHVFEPKLALLGVQVVDERHKLTDNTKPGASA